MNIQSKLAITYITLLSIGVVLISSYAILSIRSFLLEEGIQNFKNDAHTFAGSFQNNVRNENLYNKARFVSDLTGLNIALFDSVGYQLLAYPDSGFIGAEEFLNSEVLQALEQTQKPYIVNREELQNLIAFERIEPNDTEARYLRISQPKAELYAAEASIRHLIYGAMIGSILVVVVVSFLFARYLATPITQLKEAALDISGGNLDREIDLKRSDEFGSLAQSLNQMANILKSDNEQLKKLNEKQSQFFADITHEVRNPLHSISGALEMIGIENISEEKREQYHQMARRQINRITRLFEDIKALQRYDYDEAFLHKKEFDLSQVLKHVTEAYARAAEKKGITIELDTPEETFVYADPDKIEQVAENLISNAVKYTNEGEISILVSPQEKHVIVMVKDTGIGISTEHQDRLFDRFYRTDKARSRDKGGTGLGLSIVKSILTAHGSEINVSSTIGKGSEFSFSLSRHPE